MPFESIPYEDALKHTAAETARRPPPIEAQRLLDSKPASTVEPGFTPEEVAAAKAFEAGGPSVVRPQLLANPDKEAADFTKARQDSATQTPGFRRAAGTVIPMLGAAAGFVPGLQGIPAQMALGAGATYLNQAAGFEPANEGDIAIQGALGAAGPIAAKVVEKTSKGIHKAVSRFVDPISSRQAGTEAAVETVKGVPNTIDRAFASKASKAAYKEVEATATEVLMPKLHRAVTLALNQMPRVAPPKAAQDYLEQLAKDFDREPSLPYADVDKQINSMYKKAKDLMAKGEGESGSAIMDARARIIAEMDKISPALATANAEYRREHVVEKVYKAFTSGRPDLQFAKTLLDDPLVKGVLTKDDAIILESIGKQMARIPPSSLGEGRFGKIVDFFATPVAALVGSKPGIYLLRQTYKAGGGKISTPALAMLAQFGRAWTAQEADRGQ